MEFENSFTVKAPIGDVWDALIDVERAAPCMPGAKVVDRVSDDEFVVGMRVKVGPISMEYKGNVKILEKDPVAHRAVMGGSGKEVRGQGAAEATAVMLLVEHDGETTATIKSDVKLSGRAAAMGQGVIVDVTKRMVDSFSANLASLLAGPGPAEATPAVARPAGATSVVRTPVAADGGSDGAGAPREGARASDRPAQPTLFVAPAEDAALPLMSIVVPVLASRLRSPRVAVPIGIAAAAIVAFVLWRARH